MKDLNRGSNPAGQHFSRSRRLIRPAEFDRVFKQNEYRVSQPTLLLLAAPNTTGASRLGMVIGKKAVPSSVQRNRLKRTLREAFRTMELPAVDVVALARRGITDTDMRDAVMAALTKLKGRMS